MKHTVFFALVLLLGAGCTLHSTADSTDTYSSQEQAQTTEAPNQTTTDADIRTSIASGTYTITDGTAAYIAQKEFFSKPHEEVTGKTSDVSGDIVVDAEADAISVSATIDNTFSTDSSMRDGDVKKMLAGPITISGENITFADLIDQSATLNLTIAGVTKPVVFSVSVLSEDQVLSATGTGSFTVSDFSLDAPSLLNVYTVNDTLEVRFAISAAKKV